MKKEYIIPDTECAYVRAMGFLMNSPETPDQDPSEDPWPSGVRRRTPAF